MGERIIVHGRVLDGDGRPVARHAGRGLAGQRRRPLPRTRSTAPRRRSTRTSPASGRCADRRRGPLPVRHDQAGRLPVGQPPQRLAAGAHPLLAVRAGVRAAAGDADVLPGRSAVRPRPDLQLGPRPRGPRAAGRPRSTCEATEPDVGARLPLRHRAARARGRRRSRSRTIDADRHDAVADRRPVLRHRPRLAGRPAGRPEGTRGRDLAPRHRCSTAPASRSRRAGRDLAGRSGRASTTPTTRAAPTRASAASAARHRRRGPLVGLHGQARAGAGAGGAPRRRTSTCRSSPAACSSGSSPGSTSPTRRPPTRPTRCSPPLPATAAATLIAAASDDGYRFDIHLQGER